MKIDVNDAGEIHLGETDTPGVVVLRNGQRVFSTSVHIERNIWEFYEGKPGEHRWRCRDLNTKILFASTEGYAARVSAEIAARRAGWPG